MDNATLSSVRLRLIEELSNNTFDCHEKDWEKIKNNDKFIQRFIDQSMAGIKSDNHMDKVSATEVVGTIIEILKWRKEYGVNDFKPENFPYEPFRCGFAKQGTMSNGDLMFFVIGRKYQKMEEWTDTVVQMIIWIYEFLESKISFDQKIFIFIDASNCGLDQADTRIMFTGVPILIKYYPTVVTKAYFYGLSWILKPIFQTFHYLLPSKYKEKLEIISMKNISKCIGKDNIPDFLGGPMATCDLELPDGISDIVTIGRARGFSEESIQKWLNVVKKAHETV